MRGSDGHAALKYFTGKPDRESGMSGTAVKHSTAGEVRIIQVCFGELIMHGDRRVTPSGSLFGEDSVVSQRANDYWGETALLAPALVRMSAMAAKFFFCACWSGVTPSLSGIDHVCPMIH